MSKKIAYGYCRASINELKQKNSIEVQKSVISAFAESYGYELVEVFSEYQTGADDERPIFNTVLNKCFHMSISHTFITKRTNWSKVIYCIFTTICYSNNMSNFKITHSNVIIFTT